MERGHAGGDSQENGQGGLSCDAVHQSTTCPATNFTFVPYRQRCAENVNLTAQASSVFVPGRSTAGVAGALRQVLSKAAEWSVGAFVASADVEGAIDGIRHHDMTEALLQKGMHPWAVCALMRESFDLDGGAPMAPKFSHARGTRQESVEGPDMWNQVLDSALRRPAARWEGEGIGFRLATDNRSAQKRRKGPSLNGRVRHHLCCADDMCALAVAMERLSRTPLTGLGGEKSGYCCGT